MRCATLNLFDGLLRDDVAGATCERPEIKRRARGKAVAAGTSSQPLEQLLLEFEPCRLCQTCANFCKQPKATVIISCAKYEVTREGSKRR